MKKVSRILMIFVMLVSILATQFATIVAFAHTADSLQTSEIEGSVGDLLQSDGDKLTEESTQNSSSKEQTPTESGISIGEEVSSESSSLGSGGSSGEASDEAVQKSEKSQGQATVPKQSQTIATQNTANDISHQIVIKEWEIANNQGGLSQANPAVSNQRYNLSFTVDVGTLTVGDFFTLQIPQVTGAVVTDRWYMQPGDWVEQKSDEEETVIYRYRVQNVEINGVYTQEIRFEFLENIPLGAELTHEFPGQITNFVKTAGSFPVIFGNKQKNIKFEIGELDFANGFPFKFSTAVSNNSVNWGIQLNGAGNLELAGDWVNYDVNGGQGNPYQGFYVDNPLRTEADWLEWGKNYTDIWSPNSTTPSQPANYGGYIEDELPPGAEVTSMTISAYIDLPLGLTEKNLETQTGGIPSTQAAYHSHVLADYGNGPIYRKAGDTGTPNPKEGTGFTLLEQTPTETKSQFKARVQSAKYQYGIFAESSGRKTVMLHFGDMGQLPDNQQEKLSNLTDAPYTGDTFVDKDGNSVAIPTFAREAATDSIADERSDYTEADRALLERYFTLTYGETNVIGGAIAAYNISLNVRYPPDTVGSVINTAEIHTHSALSLNRRDPQMIPIKLAESAELKNPYGSVIINLGQSEVLLQKLDADNFDDNGDYISLNDAQFKLQKNVGGTWTDIKNGAGTAMTWTTADLTEGEITNAGLIKVDVSTLSDGGNGTYRFVETQAPPNYGDRNSPNWSNQAQAVVSAEFTLPTSASHGPMVTVWNRKKQVTYRVEHYVQTNQTASPDPTNDFELKQTETIQSEAGLTVTGRPLPALQVTHNYNTTYSLQHGKISGEVPESEQLVLKLYYTYEETVPFTIYKLDANHEPMPSDNVKQVQFKAYVFTWQTSLDDHPPTEANIKAGYWQRVVVDGENLALADWSDSKADLILTTDELGRLKDKRLTGLQGGDYTLGLVEIKNSYPGYSAPAADESFWVCWVNDSGTESGRIAGVTEYGSHPIRAIDYYPDGTTKYYGIPNQIDFGGSVPIYKVDESNQPMPSDGNQKVTFDIYEYIGVETIRPDKASGDIRDHNNPLRTKETSGTDPSYSENWQKVHSQATTDTNGQLVQANGDPLNLDPDKVYSVIETSTYDGYQVPDNQYFTTERTSHWLISLSGKLASGSSGYVDSRPVQHLNSFFEQAAEAAISHEGIILKNRKLTSIPIFKVDGNLDPILQQPADAFRFEVYLHAYEWTSYEGHELNSWEWKRISDQTLADSFSSAGTGRLFTEDRVLEKRVGRSHVKTEQIVAVKEVQGMNDYIWRNPNSGYWIIKLVWDDNSQTNKVTDIKYYTGFANGTHTLASLNTGEDWGNNQYHRVINGQAYLKNHRRPTYDFTFFKENEKREGLGNVEFDLYNAKNDTGDYDPNEANTRWNITDEPYQRLVSSNNAGNRGQVTLKNLTTGEYLLKEKKTAAGYQLPLGFWVIKVNAETGTIEFLDKSDPLPPAFRVEDNGQAKIYYLPNYKEFKLPASGGLGKILSVILGIIFLGLAIGLSLRSQRIQKT